METITIDYSDGIALSQETKSHLERAALCRNAINENRPFSDEQLKLVSDFFRTSITWSSNALEGFTYTIGETQTLLEYGTTIHGKSLKETLEVCGHADAFDAIIELSRADSVLISDICYLHKLIFAKTDINNAGRYKEKQNFISGSNYTTVIPEQVDMEMKKLSFWMDRNRKRLHPIVFAAEVHRKLVYIHPFSDGNGRCARLVMNLILLQNGYLPCSISPALRLDYINSLEAGRNGRNNDFIRFVAEAETETQKDYMRALNIPLPQLPPVPDDEYDMEDIRRDVSRKGR